MEVDYRGKKYMFFWNGIFSNWSESHFVVGDVSYNCGEQYMMYQKAIFFKDHITAQKILKEKNPSLQKKYGREVKNFNVKSWDLVKYELIKKGLREKFLQNEDLKKYLLKHKGCLMVETSPYDRIWGIGFKESEAICNIENWGENLLGKILTELSNEL